MDVDVLGQVVAQRSAVARRLETVRHVVAVSSGKGGVGKSALTANLAVALALDSLSIGVLDADIHGPTAALMLGARGQRMTGGDQGIEPAIGVADVRLMSMDLFLEDDQSAVRWKHPGGLAEDSYVWRGALEANVLREFLADTKWGKLDLLLIDMPPGADRFDTLIRLVPDLRGVVMVTTPGRASQLVVGRAISGALAGGARLLGLIENMADQSVSALPLGTRERPEGESGGELTLQLAESFGSQLLGRVPYDPQLALQTDGGRPLALHRADGPTDRAIRALAAAIREALDR